MIILIKERPNGFQTPYSNAEYGGFIYILSGRYKQKKNGRLSIDNVNQFKINSVSLEAGSS